MEFDEVLRRRHMVRSFAATPLDGAVVERVFEAARRVPSAGNTAGTAWVLLQGEARSQYWDHATTPPWRQRSARYAGLARAPLVALALASPQAYVERYSEPDKAASRLGGPGPGGPGLGGPGLGGPGPGGPGLGGGGADAWPVPYWYGDAAFATMGVLLAATAQHIGAAFLGNFRGEAEVLTACDVPPQWQLFGAVLLGHPDGADHRSASLDRGRPALADLLHRQRW